MDQNTFIGILIILAGLGFLTFLTFWSRGIINRIANKREKSMREIMQDLKND